MNYDKTVKDFIEELGFVWFENIEGDVDLRSYIVESMDFIRLIALIEDYYSITFPDSALRYDILASKVALDNLVKDLIEKNKNLDVQEEPNI